jgi:predicted methyltransferase
MTRMKTLPPPSTVRRLLLALPAALLLASCAMPDAPASTSLDAAIAAPYRGQKAQARDVYRHPKQTLEFFGVEPTQSVLEIAPGGGWSRTSSGLT